MKKLLFWVVFLASCGAEVGGDEPMVVRWDEQCYDVSALAVCEPPSMSGGCFVDDDDTIFRPCDRRLGFPRAGGCYARFLDGVAAVEPDQITSCRTCLRRYLAPNQVEAYCSIYDFAE